MGRFASSVHARVGTASREGSRLAEAVDGWVRREGFEPVGDDAVAHRLIVLSPQGQWVEVAATDCARPDGETFAAHLSRATGSPAVRIELLDSALLSLVLWGDGELLDHAEVVHDSPDPESQVGPVPPSPAVWAPLVGATRAGALQRAWASARSLHDLLEGVEHTLDLRTPVLDMLGGRTPSTAAADTAEGAQETRLAFQAPPDAAWLASADTPPLLTAWGEGPDLGGVGEPLRWTGRAVSRGGPAHGVTVRVSGDAVTQGALELTEVTVASGRGRHVASAPLTVGRDGTRWAHLPGAPVPRGCPSQPEPGLSTAAVNDVWEALEVWVRLEGMRRREQRGALEVRAAPDGAEHASRWRWGR